MTAAQLQQIAELFDRSAGEINFWWVNHKQTYRQERGGGYIWSPKKNRDGGTNQTYLNLPKTRVGDFVFSFANGKIGAVGIVVGVCRSASRPREFGEAGKQWDKNGWLVPIEWIDFGFPFKTTEHASQIAPFLPSKHSTIRNNGAGNQGCYLAGISSELGRALFSYSPEVADKAAVAAVEIKGKLLDDEAEKALKEQTIGPLQKEQLILARRGQGRFRSDLTLIEKGCRLTGVTDTRFLIASHIKPWRDSSNDQKLDKHNGLLLSPHVDKLFDNGWISIDESSHLILASTNIERLMSAWGLDITKNLGQFLSPQQEYLEYHRANVFRG